MFPSLRNIALVALVLANASWCLAETRRPNIVVILADDLGYADCGFSHGQQIRTPAIDDLASRGTVLESFYVQPVCSPTRAALMTGRYPMRHGLQVGVIRPTANYGLPLDERLLPQALKDIGYRTAICGKWHLGSFDQAYWPGSRGFDHAFGHLFGALDYFTHIRDGKLDWYRNGKLLEQEGYTTHLVADEAIAFVERQTSDKPFFLYLPFNAVHTPLQVPDKYMEPYKDLPDQRRKYAGMLAALDEAVGRIVSKVEEKGFRSNTLFLFSADNGGFNPGVVTNNGPLRAGKGTLYEGGVRGAAFATWEGEIRGGVRSNEPVHIVDVMPTLCKLTGARGSDQHPWDGMDVWSTIARGEKSPHQTILLNTTPTVGAVRVGNWKLKLNQPTAERQPAARRRNRADTEEVELFNLQDDLSEQTNLAGKMPEKVQELKAIYSDFAQQAKPPRAQQ